MNQTAFLKRIWIGTLLILCANCGYSLVDWSPDQFQTIDIRPVSGPMERNTLRVRMQDALITRCLAGSGLRPSDNTETDLRLTGQLLNYEENVIATDPDGRTKTIQFNFVVSFNLQDRNGKTLWSLNGYRYSDQFDVSTRQAAFRDESVFLQDEALRAVADLVVTNITLAVSEQPAPTPPAEEASNE
ncbi:LPS assembly lipoprotein LptE [Acanthopleuribacter pedis]|uniref:LPS-assembly lipoprotein LptE n=1 Tax=Acanthopleuribacter pedis TaxID=442870 RepID=A0A8J7QI47_9BACT|nr:LPS assembly lipoprotein LptE [Acanthopleuribacter pedis]MBO1322845.1 hypothetical protein [Acanthopleuribacter pedis]